jgi:hypothetical protein
VLVLFTDGIIFARNDGWGNIKSVYGVSTAGYVEVNAWCNLKTSHEEVLQFGPGIINESMQFNFPNIYSAFEAFHITMMVFILTHSFIYKTFIAFVPLFRNTENKVNPLNSRKYLTFEPRHDKTNVMRLRPAWIQTSLRICAV